jgi:translation initiation factor 1 (eIF-1/SUI1)
MMKNPKISADAVAEESILDMVKMAAELDEHRYYLEKNIAIRTEQLLKRITLIESCNETLCAKLAAASKELETLKQQLACSSQVRELPQLYLMNHQSLQEEWSEHAAAV